MDLTLVSRGLVDSRNIGVRKIKAGEVLVDGVSVTKAAFSVSGVASIEILGSNFVSKGAHKLLDALRENPDISVKGAVCLDIGACTGGFTEVLLNAGAKQVVAIDVGHGQLAPALASDPRVVNMEGTNIRDIDTLKLANIPQIYDIIVSDVSFISLAYVLPTVAKFLARNGVALILIKPQFELGRIVINKCRGGVVTDPTQHQEAIDLVKGYAGKNGLLIENVLKCHEIGKHGNQEFIARMSLECRASVARVSLSN